MSDYTPELLSGNQQWFVWTVRSRTSQIPSSGMGNTDPMFSYSTGDSSHYNQLWYQYIESFLLQYDTTTSWNLYYTWWNTSVFFSGGEFTWMFRLPPKVYDEFGWIGPADLCDSYVGVYCDLDSDGIYDDISLSRSLQGWYQGQWFTIYPTITVFYYSGMQVDEYNDNALRESIINAGGSIDSTIGDYTFIAHGTNLSKHTVVSSVADDIETDSFSTIFDGGEYTGLRLSFGAVNFFRTYTGAIYPYLEYQFTFPHDIADRFYTIQWQGRVGEYDVRILLKKPTVQWTIWGDFTVIF